LTNLYEGVHGNGILLPHDTAYDDNDRNDPPDLPGAISAGAAANQFVVKACDVILDGILYAIGGGSDITVTLTSTTAEKLGSFVALNSGEECLFVVVATADGLKVTQTVNITTAAGAYPSISGTAASYLTTGSGAGDNRQTIVLGTVRAVNAGGATTGDLNIESLSEYNDKRVFVRPSPLYFSPVRDGTISATTGINSHTALQTVHTGQPATFGDNGIVWQSFNSDGESMLYYSAKDGSNRHTHLLGPTNIDVSSPSTNQTFTFDGNRVFVLTPSTGITLNPSPSSTFPPGHTVFVSVPSGSTVTFDSTGLNQAIAAGNALMFAYDGTNWKRVLFSSTVATTSSGASGLVQLSDGAGGFTSDSTLSYDTAANELTVNGKLTVTGLIDPTGLELTPQASNPAAADAGVVDDNTLWLDSGASNRLKHGELSVMRENDDISELNNDAGFVDAAGAAAAAPATNLTYTASTRVIASSTGTNATLTEVVAGGNSGLMTGAQATKLDGIEVGATADQTAVEIKTAYESNDDTNAFTDDEQTKLAGIATGAEVNVNADWNAVGGDAEILNKPTDVTNLATHSVTELNDVTNAGSGAIITSAERATLGTALQAETDPLFSISPAASITNAGSGAVITSAERTKLTGIETGATADQNADEVPVAAHSPTNYSAATADVEAHLVGIDNALASAGSVSSVFGRTGAVVATSGDYDDSEITAAASATNYTPTASTVEGHLAGIDTALGSVGGGGTPSGAAGAIQFSDGLAFDDDGANLYWDDGNNRLGVGTNTPTNALHVITTEYLNDGAYAARFQAHEGNVGVTRYGGIHISNDNTAPIDGDAWESNRWQIGQRDGNQLDFSYGSPTNTNIPASDTDLRITATGDVGIGLGATDPSAKLHVSGNVLIEDGTTDGSSDHLLEVKSGQSGTPDNARILISADTDVKLPMFHLRDIEANGGTFNANYSAYIALDRASAIVTGSAQNDMLIANGNYNKDIHLCTNNAGNGSSAQARLTIVGSDGDVGIGTTSPAQKLHVNGTIRQTGATSAVLVANANGDLVAASNLTDTAYSTTDTTDAAADVYAANPAYWAGPPPTTVAEALDRIAAHLNNPAFSPPGPIP